MQKRNSLFLLFLMLIPVILISGCISSSLRPENVKNTSDCTSHANVSCYNGSLYWFDSCGNRESVKEFCLNGCENRTCIIQNNNGDKNSNVPNQTCTDSDGGRNYSLKGVTRGLLINNYTGEPMDKCTSVNILQEFYCDSEGFVEFETYRCPYLCVNDVCMEECVPEGNASISNNLTCCEGLNKINNSYQTMDGSCKPSDYGVFICSKCGDGICGNGENKCNCPLDCKNQKCADSDGGINYSLKGTATSGLLSKTDVCSCEEICSAPNSCRNSCNVVLEYYCVGDEIKQQIYDCPNGCDSGACRERCKDGEIKNRYDDNYVSTCAFTNIWYECVDGQWLEREQNIQGTSSCGGG